MKRGKLWKIRNSVSLLFRLWLVFKFSRGLLRRNWKSNHPCIRRKFIVNFSSLWRNRINPPLFNHYSWVESYKIASLSEIFLLNFNFELISFVFEICIQENSIMRNLISTLLDFSFHCWERIYESKNLNWIVSSYFMKIKQRFDHSSNYFISFRA